MSGHLFCKNVDVNRLEMPWTAEAVMGAGLRVVLCRSGS
jgi:hypothetical protein